MSGKSAQQNYGAGKLPVFVFPTSLTFYSVDQTSHKQIMTLYNPYDFTFKYKVWCTTPMRYSVSEADGLIRPKCCTDIVIRHKAVIPENEGKPDKFRIQITDHANKSILGKKDISAVLLPHPEGLSSNEKFESMSSGTTSLLSAMTAAGSATLPPSHRMPSNRSGGSNWLTVLAAVLCLICLFLPESERLSSTAITWLPSYLLPSTTHKLIAAYVLGILTVVLLRN